MICHNKNVYDFERVLYARNSETNSYEDSSFKKKKKLEIVLI